MRTLLICLVCGLVISTTGVVIAEVYKKELFHTSCILSLFCWVLLGPAASMCPEWLRDWLDQSGLESLYYPALIVVTGTLWWAFVTRIIIGFVRWSK